MPILSVKNLSFSYQKGQPILEGLNMMVPPESIYGFLGSNGAGKSTTIRNILGLLRPQAGEISIFEENAQTADRRLFQKVGTLIESPSLYPNLSARDHLRLACRYQQIAEERIQPTLEKVGLWAHKDKTSKRFSTGMKQRLGLAMALLHEPELLLLDEPTNGLDPQGISDIRALLKQLQQEGKTIFLSSHLLSEIEKTATHVGIIKGGHLVFEGSKAALEEWKSSNLQVQIRTSDPLQTIAALSSEELVLHEANNVTIKLSNESQIPDLIRRLVTAKIDIYQVKLLQGDLEKLFMELTSPENGER